MAYTTLAQLKNYLGITADTDDVLLERLIDRAQAAIDTHCGRSFEASTATRYFERDAVKGNYLYLDDDLLTITTLTNGDDSSTVIPNTEYWLWPRNEGPPYWAIRLEANSTYSWEVDTDYMISVAGTWGWATTVPADITDACEMWVKYKYHQKDSGVIDATAFPAEGIIVTPQGKMPIAVYDSLEPYLRRAG